MRLTPDLLAALAKERLTFDDEPEPDSDEQELEAEAEPTPRPVVDPATLPLLLLPSEASALLGVSVEAFYQRVRRGQVPGVVKTGRKVEVHRDVLLESLEKQARRGRR
jgi:hypothetical protein